MKKNLTDIEDDNTTQKSIFFSFGQISDISAYQSFTLLIFTFYFAVVRVPTYLITTGFIIWSIWNSINDPIIGYISDRTNTKYGRRIPWIIGGFIPLALITIFLYTPPIPGSEEITNQLINFGYFLIIIILFEWFYTMYSLNLTSLFPEVFINEKERTKANNIRQVFTIVGLVIAFILPGIIIGDYTDLNNLGNYQLFGIIIAIIIIIGALIFLKFGPKEKKEFSRDYENAPKFIQSIKQCVRSKSFMWYIPAEIANWFVYGMLPTIVPLYGEFVLGLEEGAFMISLLLGMAFISAALFITILWKPVVRRIGNRKAWMISMSIWIITLIPLLFLGSGMELIALIIFFLIGIGLSGSLYIIDLVVSDIIDEDEINCGIRREAAYYGVNALFLRLSTVLVMLSVGIVFDTTGWRVFDPTVVTEFTRWGLKFLMVILPSIALIIGILSIYKYPLDKTKLSQIREKLDIIHKEKKSKL